MEVRAGSTIDKLELDSNAAIDGGALRYANTTLSLEYLQPGYSDRIVPNKTDHRGYLLNENFNNTDMVLTNTDGTVREIAYDSITGQRMVYPSGTLYYSSGLFFDLAAYKDGVNRFFKTGFKFNRPAVQVINLASSTDGSGIFWNIYIDSDRSIVIEDDLGTYRTYEQILDTSTPKEIIVERDMAYETDIITDHEYGVYYREGDNVFTKLGLTRFYVDNPVPDGYITKAFENATVDVKYIQVYEEPREFTDV
jgi:hypothetical protein